jgi:xylulokinase
VVNEYLLAFDLGTTGNKATLFSFESEAIASVFKEYPTFYPEPGWAEQQPADWWKSIQETTQELLGRGAATPQEIAAIGISGHMMGCLPVDRKGVPLCRAIIHSDSRSFLESALVEERVGGASVYEITGQRIDPHYSLTKAMWVQRHAPEIWRKTRFLLQCKDYAVFQLTGSLGTTDFSDASLSGAYDLAKLSWSKELLSEAGLDQDLFPEVVPSSQVVGWVSKEAAGATGLRQGTPVVAGGGDGACATLGAGVVTPGDAYNYIGGTSWIAALLDRPDVDPQRRLFLMGSVEFGHFCIIGTMQAAGSSLRWLADEICCEEQMIATSEGIGPFDVMDRRARNSPPGSRKLFFLPYMMGERAPIWDPMARGVFLGLTLSHKREDMIRAVLEGVAYSLNSILEVITERGLDIGALKVIGGGAKSEFWLEILASVFNLPVEVPDSPGEATSRGAALTAGVGVGVFGSFAEAATKVRMGRTRTPKSDWVSTYNTLYPYYRSLYPALRESYQRLAGLDLVSPDGPKDD